MSDEIKMGMILGLILGVASGTIISFMLYVMKGG